ncbi:MAG: fumarate hydratase [Deltaproteobacteria bacterium]|nr:fumarate hydratase [Deltaproteobacteria bacterium]
MENREIFENILCLIEQASTVLPEDVSEAIRRAIDSEEGGSRAKRVLEIILENVKLARERRLPICQDTGTLIFYVDKPKEIGQSFISEEICRAVREATRSGILRPNAVDPITNKNSGDNIGIGSPYIHFDEWDRDEIRARLILKGGGSENVSIQYSLPNSELMAGRDVEGIKKCIIDAAFRAQGFGCSPGILAVGIGGDRMTSFMCAKEQLFRRLDDKNPDETLRNMEAEIYNRVNELGIGPMGFGGKTTILGVKIGKRHRVPASFFISVAYMCWAFRRAEIVFKI